MVIFSFAFEDFEFGNTDGDYLNFMRGVFIKIEIAFLMFFLLEIFLNVFVYGTKIYFSSYLNIVDFFIIIVSICLAYIDLYTASSFLSNLSRSLRGATRFFRIFILFRKVQQHKTVNRLKGSKNASPLESVLEILKVVKLSLSKKNHVKNVDWVIEILAENKLYAPLCQGKDSESLERITEVNKWIEGYSPTKAKRRSLNSKPRRISGGVSDEIIRKSIILDIPISIIKNFVNIDELEFNCFQACEISKENSISNLLIYLFHKYDLLSCLGIENTKLYAFGGALQRGYRDNPFHNYIHGFDTCQTMNFFLGKLELAKKKAFSKVEIASILVAAAGHDLNHQ